MRRRMRAGPCRARLWLPGLLCVVVPLGLLAGSALADSHAGRARTAQSVPDVTGAWHNRADSVSPSWQLTASNGLQTLEAHWAGGPGHSSLRGSFLGTLSGAGVYEGTFHVTEGEVNVSGSMSFKIDSASQIEISYESNGSKTGPIVFVPTSVSVPLTLAAAPLAALFGAVVQVGVPSGGDGLAASPPLGDTSAATVTEAGLSPEDTTVAALVTYAALRHQCYVTAVQRVAFFYKLNLHLSQGAAQDEAAIQKLSESLAESTPTYIKACLAYVDAAVAGSAATASASACTVAPLTIVSQRRRGKTSISKVQGGAVKGLSVTCSRSAGVLTMHLRSKPGTPLSKFVGSRLRIAVARSKHDPGPATLSFSFRKG